MSDVGDFIERESIHERKMLNLCNGNLLKNRQKVAHTIMLHRWSKVVNLTGIQLKLEIII